MCGPMMGILGAGISAMGAVAKGAAEQKATDEYNAQAAAAHRDAEIAATLKYKDLGNRYVYDTKANNQEGYKNALKGRAEVATGLASAGAAGIASGSNTLNSLEAQSRQITANNEANIQTKRDDLHDTLVAQDASVQAEAQARINSTPFKSGPNPMTAMLGVASAITGGFQGSSGGTISSSSSGINTDG